MSKTNQVNIETVVVPYPKAILHKEVDDWAVLTNTSTKETFGFNPFSVLIWNHINGRRSIGDIAREVMLSVENRPEEFVEHIMGFAQNLYEKGLVTLNNQ